MNRFSKNKQILSLIGIFIVLFSAVIFFLAYPYYLKIQETNDQIYDQRVQLAILEQQRLNIEQTHQDYNKIKKDLDTIQMSFINTDDMLKFISKFEEIAKKTHVEQNINLSTSTSNLVDNKLPFILTLSGSWQNIFDYISELESLDTYVLVDSISYSKNNASLSVILSANVFSQQKK
jgi:Tfp pilus assembly protein PilO